MHCLRVETSIVLQSKHFFLGQFGVKLTVVVSAYNLNGEACCSVFACLVKKPTNEAKTKN